MSDSTVFIGERLVIANFTNDNDVNKPHIGTENNAHLAKTLQSDVIKCIKKTYRPKIA